MLDSTQARVDLARLWRLCSAPPTSPEALAATREALARLLARAPRARRQVRLLHVVIPGGPSRLELARLVAGASTPAALPKTWITALWVLRGSATGSIALEELERIAWSAGRRLLPGRAKTLLQLDDQLQRLLAEDAWRDPAEILGGTQASIDGQALLRLATAHLHRKGKGDRRRLLAILPRLQRFALLQEAERALQGSRDHLRALISGGQAPNASERAQMRKLLTALHLLQTERGAAA